MRDPNSAYKELKYVGTREDHTPLQGRPLSELHRLSALRVNNLVSKDQCLIERDDTIHYDSGDGSRQGELTSCFNTWMRVSFS